MELNSVLPISGEITAEPVEEEQRFKEAHRAKILAKTRKKSSIYFTSHPHFNDRSISFHNVSYVIKPARTFLKNSTPKVILCNVSGIMGVGLHAIMGPSGGGKTTLLDVLADRKSKKGLSGDVLINGKRQPHNFKCASAYVVQDDIVVGTLTVRENLMFSAALRLPKSYSWADRKEKVDTAIDELGLRKVANSRIGTEILRGVSGGERKRTSIGMELIISPNFVFLDEPTTGLDSATAISVLKLLKDLSTTNRVIVLAIHQPRYSIFKLFDSLTLLSNGELVYHGPTTSAINYFSRIGFVCEKHDNPADFFLDVISTNERSVNDEASKEKTALTTVFKNSYEYEEIQTVLKPLLDKAFNEPREMSPKYNTYFPWQLLVVSARTLLNIIRDPLLALTQVVVMICLAFLVGIVFLHVEDSFVGVQNRIGAIFFVLINISFGSLFSIEFVIKEGVIFRHENVSGYYRVSSYFLAKVICDVVPLRILPSIIFALITYWMIGLEPEASNFFIYLITLILTAMATAGVAFAIGVLVNVVALANITAAFTYIFMLVFTGFLININSLGAWILWLQYISIFRYALHALAVNELSDNIYCNSVSTFDDETNTTVSMCNFTQAIIGNTFLEEQKYDELPLWQNEMALLLVTIVLFLLTYIILRITKKEK